MLKNKKCHYAYLWCHKFKLSVLSILKIFHYWNTENSEDFFLLKIKIRWKRNSESLYSQNILPKHSKNIQKKFFNLIVPLYRFLYKVGLDLLCRLKCFWNLPFYRFSQKTSYSFLQYYYATYQYWKFFITEILKIPRIFFCWK